MRSRVRLFNPYGVYIYDRQICRGNNEYQREQVNEANQDVFQHSRSYDYKRCRHRYHILQNVVTRAIVNSTTARIHGRVSSECCDCFKPFFQTSQWVALFRKFSSPALTSKSPWRVLSLYLSFVLISLRKRLCLPEC